MPTVPITRTCPGVEPRGDFLVFNVASSSPGTPDYRVDLQKFCGHGECDCPNFRLALSVDWQGRKITKLAAMLNGAIPSAALECKHIRFAKRYLLFRFLNELIESREKEANDNKKQAQARSMAYRVPGTGQPKASRAA
jgi:hypothetical protein